MALPNTQRTSHYRKVRLESYPTRRGTARWPYKMSLSTVAADHDEYLGYEVLSTTFETHRIGDSLKKSVIPNYDPMIVGCAERLVPFSQRV